VEKKNLLLLFLFGFIIGFGATIFVGCANRPGIVVTTDEAIVAATRSVDQLAAINDRVGKLLQWADSRIEGLIGEAIGGIDDAFRLLDEYDEFVSELIGRIAELRYLAGGGTGQAYTTGTD